METLWPEKPCAVPTRGYRREWWWKDIYRNRQIWRDSCWVQTPCKGKTGRQRDEQETQEGEGLQSHLYRWWSSKLALRLCSKSRFRIITAAEHSRCLATTFTQIPTCRSLRHRGTCISTSGLGRVTINRTVISIDKGGIPSFYLDVFRSTSCHFNFAVHYPKCMRKRD